jgi:Arc/MetJ family transcription regulator
MRTNIVLNDQLVEQAFLFAPVKTKRELVEYALREFVEQHQRRNLLDLAGKVKIRDDYDYKAMRASKEG